MGPGSWIIIAIVVLQLVAGAVAKAAEARKAKGQPPKKGLGSLLSEIKDASKGERGTALGKRKQSLEELTTVTEDTVEYFCDKCMVSGQLAWTVLHMLTICKMAEFEESIH